MATARQTITRALRKLRAIGRGEAPESDQATYALEELNGLLSSMVEVGLGYPLENYRITGSVTVSLTYPAQRLQCMNGGITITLPGGTMAKPVWDGARVSVVDVSNNAGTNNIILARNGWLLEGAAANQTLATNGIRRTWMFRADLGDWKRAADLGLDDDLPYPTDFDRAWGLILAEALQGEYGMSLGPDDLRAARAGREALYIRYARPLDAVFDSAVTSAGGTSAAVGYDDSLDGSYT